MTNSTIGKTHSTARVLIFLLAISLGSSSGLCARVRQTAPPLPREDSVLIAETYHLWRTLGEKLWPGWTEVPMPLIYVTENYEYAVGFPRPLDGFTQLGQNILFDKSVQVRKRIFGTHVAATFPYEGFATIAIGTPASLQKSPAAWALLVINHMFSVLQQARGSIQKIAQLKIGADSDPSWQLNFPFPYKDDDVRRLIHLQAYPLFLAATGTGEDDVKLKYNASIEVEANEIYRTFLNVQPPKSYDYSRFQEWTGGVALYTEYEIAKGASDTSYRPLPAFRQLAGYQSYGRVWDEEYKNRLSDLSAAGSSAQSRSTFSQLGFGKALLLDRLLPDWKTRYFAPGVWLDDLVKISLGRPDQAPVVKVGGTAPDFSLASLDGTSVSLGGLKGKIVLLDFWQTWCVPCVAEIPRLNDLEGKYGEKGLVILGVTDRLDEAGIATLRRFQQEHAITYPLLLDDKGVVAAQYGITDYPHMYLIDRAGHVVWETQGNNSETEFHEAIQTALSKSGAE